MSGLFGGDALERKFGSKPPDEWVATLSRLKDFEIDRGLRRLVYSGKPHVPSLPEFVRFCRLIADDEVDEGPRFVALPTHDSQKFDRWSVDANTHFLGYITRAFETEPRRWGAPHSADQRAATEIAVRYKNAWTQDMREWDIDPSTGEVLIPSPEDQRRTWDDCMRLAEVDIAALFLKAAA